MSDPPVDPPPTASTPIASRGRVVEDTDRAVLDEAIEHAFDYRGDVTITCRSSADPIEGFVFDRRNGSDSADTVIRVVARHSGQRLTIARADIRSIAFTGRDAAAGKSFETWVRSYVQKKLAGEAASLEPEPLEDA